MTHQELWAAYQAACPEEYAAWDRANPDRVAEYEAWAYGDQPDLLAELTRTGVKTATSSAAVWYAVGYEPMPEAGEYSIILDSRDGAVCVTRTTKVYTVPFRAVTAEHAYKEGEGDRSLDYWRRVHEDFFRAELAEAGLEFTPDMQVVCEEFEVVFRPKEETP